MEKQKSIIQRKKYIRSFAAILGIVLAISAGSNLFYTTNIIQAGYYSSIRFGQAMEPLLSIVSEYIFENDVIYDQNAKSYELTEDFLKENQTYLETAAIALRSEKQEILQEMEKTDTSGWSESEKKAHQKEIEKLMTKIENAEASVKEEVIAQKLQTLQDLESVIQEYKNVAIRIQKDGREIYKQGDVPSKERMDSFSGQSGFYWLGVLDSGDRIIQRIGGQGASYEEIDPNRSSYEGYRPEIRNRMYREQIFSIFHHGLRDRSSRSEIIFYINGSPQNLKEDDQIRAYYGRYQKDIFKRQTYFGGQLVLGIALCSYALFAGRRKSALIDPLTEGAASTSIMDDLWIEKKTKRLIALISKLKLEIKMFLVLAGLDSISYLLSRNVFNLITEDITEFIKCLILAFIGVMIAIDFFRSDKEAYLKNSLYIAWRDRRRKKKLRGVAKGLDFIFDSIALVGLVILFTLVILISGGSEGLYLLTSAIGGSYILFMVWILHHRICDDRIAYIDEISDRVQKMIDGDLIVTVPERPDHPFGALAHNINKMKQGYGTAMEEKIRSEKMKTELITNVSHDLKTPLTSIINYVDLLKKENIEPEYARDYVTILEQKSERLNVLIQDLFEVSKAASGDMALCLEKLDVTELLRQTLAEMDGKIQDSQLDFIVNIPTDPIYIIADGKKLHRVFDNLIINILKYSLKGTRVYIDFVRNGHVKLSMKNISNYEMNFTQEEIVQRFTRADKARSGEGSGLGLAIAKSFVDLMNMDMRISTDGDLFKVELEMQIAQ
ncbi:MAG: HAMP domain-containing sensor histidine kinase [Peptostreptococcaceae bacterium]|nr:HAMP domain-containing sensor histidine kinase [Peptostreptococcaceae bacterium]